MKKMKRTLLIALLLFVATCCLPAQASAMTKANKKAHTALDKQLKKDKKKYRSGYSSGKLKYAYADIDGDKVDELITEPGFGYLTQVAYDYSGGKVREVCGVGQGIFTKYFPKKQVVYIHNSGHMGVLCDKYYKKSGKKYALAAYVVKDYGNRSYDEAPISTTYYVREKESTKSAYKAYVKKLTKGDSGRKFKALKWKYY